MTAIADNLLGIGLYTPAEAALYARVPVQTMNRWIYGDKKGVAVLEAQLAAQEDRFITFLDFVQALAIRQIRNDLDVTLSKIREGIAAARKRYDIQYPLAMNHTTFLYGGELIIRKVDDDENEHFIQLTGKEAHHRMIQKVVRVYMKDLTFGDLGLAESYRAYTHESVEVSMNPKIRFGEPLLRSCGYSARALWEATRAEGSVEEAADEYGVTPSEAEAAYRYYESLQIPKAA